MVSSAAGPISWTTGSWVYSQVFAECVKEIHSTPEQFWWEKIVRWFPWVDSGFEDVRAETKRSEPVRNWRVSGHLFTKPGRTFSMLGSGILTVRPPVRKQTLCLDHQNDVFLNVHNGFFTSRYRHEAPIGDCLSKKQLGRFGSKFNIRGKKGKFIVKMMVMV
jgi:hypothetical protein